MNKLAVLIAAISLAGCGVDATHPRQTPSSPPVANAIPATHPTTQPATTTIFRATTGPFLLHLPGIGGRRAIDVNMTRGLVAGGYTGSVHIYDWTENDEGLTSLWGVERHRRQAKLIAEQLTAAYDADPTRPIYLTAHSGGTGLAVWGLELSPERIKVRSLLLLEPALSPTYDLSKALRHVSDRAYAFSSTSDPVVGLGCRMMGTIDGPKVAASGNVGFTRPPTADVGQYRKLVALPYDSTWMKWYNYGDHVGPMSRAFGSKVLAPLLFHDVMPVVETTTRAAGQ